MCNGSQWFVIITSLFMCIFVLIATRGRKCKYSGKERKKERKKRENHLRFNPSCGSSAVHIIQIQVKSLV